MPAKRQPGVMASINPAQIRQLRSADRPALRARLLGPFSLETDAGPIVLAAKRSRVLVAYLIRRKGLQVPRSSLSTLLWGERSEDQARASLRQALSELRSAFAALPVQPITATNEWVTWSEQAAEADVTLVEAGAASDNAADWEAAHESLRGEFLEGLALNEPGAEQWLAEERAHFRKLTSLLLAKLMEAAESGRNFDQALSYGQSLLSLDPLQEHVHRALMRMLAAQNRPEAALSQYERCKRELETQLGISPDSETEALVRSIRMARRTGSPPKPVETTPPPSLPAKPSIAVLPFINLSNDPHQEFFADGMTEDIISALSHIHDLFVIARSSSFIYKGQQVLAQRVAAELGVRYVLEGSVRAAGGRVRVNAQLIDGTTGSNVWTERYEGHLDDIFAVQDEITRSIALAMEIKLTSGDSARLWESQTRNLRAWEKLVVARGMLQRYTTADISTARRLVLEALELDPGFSGARALLAITYYWDARFSVTLDLEQSLQLGEREASILLTADPGYSAAHVLRGAFAFMRDRHGEAIASGNEAVKLSPGDSRALAFLGMFQMFAGEPEKSFGPLRAAMAASPKVDSWYRYYLTLAHLWTGELDAALASAELYIAQEPAEPYGFMYLAAVRELAGRHVEAVATISELGSSHPAFGLANVRRSERYRRPETMERLLLALTSAGFSS